MALDKYKKRPYSLEDYGPKWAAQFAAIKPEIQRIFGPKALKIEHVGSTSFGIKAKPVLDVLIVVRSIEDVTEHEKSEMQKMGYEFEENYIGPRTAIFYRQNADGKRLENIHVAEPNSKSEEQFILKRDYFLAHPEKAKEYENLKEKLNKEFPDDYPAYREGKDSFLKDILKLAIGWKENNS